MKKNICLWYSVLAVFIVFSSSSLAMRSDNNYDNNSLSDCSIKTGCVEVQNALDIEEFFIHLNNNVVDLVLLDELLRDAHTAELIKTAPVHDVFAYLLTHIITHRPYNFKLACSHVDMIVEHFPCIEKQLFVYVHALPCFTSQEQKIKHLRPYQQMFLCSLDAVFPQDVLNNFDCMVSEETLQKLCLHIDIRSLLFAKSTESFDGFSFLLPVFYTFSRINDFLCMMYHKGSCDLLSNISIEADDLLAIYCDDVDSIQSKFFIQSFTDATTVRIRGIDLLSLAAFAGARNLFAFLFLQECAINHEVCINAFRGGNCEIIRLCEQHINEFTPHCFYEAIRFRRNIVADWFIRLHGKNLEHEVGPAFLLYNLRYVIFCIQNGADINKSFRDVRLPLVNALTAKNYAWAEFFIRFGAKVDQEDMSAKAPLHIAASINDVQMTLFLIEHGANVNHLSSCGQTPLFCAVCNSADEVADLLEIKGALFADSDIACNNV